MPRSQPGIAGSQKAYSLDDIMESMVRVAMRKHLAKPLSMPTGVDHEHQQGASWSGEFDGEGEPEEDYTLIGTTIGKFNEAHSHRVATSRYQTDRSIFDFLRVTGLHENNPIQLIDRAACQKWRAALVKSITDGKRKAVTVQMALSSMGQFTRWLCTQDVHGFAQDPMRGLRLNIKVVAASKVRKEGFSDAELALIAGSLKTYRTNPPEVTGSRGKDNRRERCIQFSWLCLALMMSGCRLSEMLEIQTCDVRQVEGMWCFDIKPDASRHIKNSHSIRFVPCHSALIASGFLDYHSTVTTERLFPVLLKTGGHPLVTRWFTAILRELGVKRNEVSLHSLRHTFAQALELKHVHQSVAHRLMGHTVGTGAHAIYLRGTVFPMADLKDGVEALKFPVAG